MAIRAQWAMNRPRLSKTGPDLVKFFHAAQAAGGDFMFKLPRIAGCILGCCLLSATPSLVLAQAAVPAKPAAPAKPAVGTLIPPAQTYGKVLSIMEQQFVSAAEAMPEDKYNFAPPATLGEFKDVRTFASQIKHVTEANYYFFHDPSQPMIDIRPDIEKLTTKADIVKALKDSFANAHAFMDTITAGECLCADGAWHARGIGGLWNRALHGSLRPDSCVPAHERDCPPRLVAGRCSSRGSLLFAVQHPHLGGIIAGSRHGSGGNRGLQSLNR
jgi:hypothetical protein